MHAARAPPFGRRARRDASPRRRSRRPHRARAAPCGRPCRWRQRQRVERDEVRGHHVVGQASARGARAARSAAPACRRARRRSRPAARRPAGPRARPPPPGDRRVRASAASISPSSMRKPRTLTWKSCGRGTRACRPRASGRGRRCDTAALGRPNGIGDEPLGGELGAVAGSRRHAVAADVQLAGHADRHRLQPRVEHVAARCWRSAGRCGPCVAAAGTRQQVDQTVVSVGPYMFHSSPVRSSSAARQIARAAPRRRTARLNAGAGLPSRLRAAAARSPASPASRCAWCARSAPRSAAPSARRRAPASTTSRARGRAAATSSSTAMSNESVVTATSRVRGREARARAPSRRGS